MQVSPWQGSVAESLQAERQRVLEHPDFRATLPSVDDFIARSAQLDAAPDDIVTPQTKVDYAAALYRCASDGPMSPDDALLLMADSMGTGTIIDALTVDAEARAATSDSYNSCVLSPLPDSMIADVFGSDTPSVEALAVEVGRLREIVGGRNDGRFVIGFEAGQPVAVLFWGNTGPAS